MRYSKQHKIETHARIVRKASARLRQKGAHGIGVADLMKDAGLTHGGFYAHFRSREALLIEALAHAMDRSTEHWRYLAEQVSAEGRLAAIVGHYLSSHHRDNPGGGCALATLGAEVARESLKTRRAFAVKLAQMIDQLAGHLPDRPAAAARNQAMAVLATLLGTILMARIAGSDALSEDILKAGRAAVIDHARSPRAVRKKPAAKKTAARARVPAGQ